ncbi:V-type ATP synthase subunit C [Oxobacter pfennigii]|uniref:V-type ATP synthase subunit C n=1 Tax=Oxobacter pfennigii TaxID=36849 RepID=A0A0P8YA18_9CLOT|nr:V-type ATPase subunit [Oxobacter pfennigii]KPU43782.1 V-type ATP synthase subunit C [Oxobacter pfennigii]
MNKFIHYEAVNTKIRALESRFLKEEDFNNLLNKKGINEIAAYLKNETHYKSVLHDIDENKIHRGELEILIRKDHVKQIGKLIFYFNNNYKKFFRYVFLKREIEDLKKVLRSIKNGKISSLNRESFAHLGQFSGIRVDSLLSSKTIDDFILSLKGTEYYSYLLPLEEEKGEKNIFLGEMVLDLAYFDIFYKTLESLNKNDKKIIDELQGTSVDLLNIQWIYRGINYYNMPRELLFNYTIPHGHILSVRDIKELCYCTGLKEFEDKILNTKYNFLFDNENTKNMFMERRSLRYQYYIVKKLKKRHRMDILEAIAFDVLLEFEIRDIITVIESIRYDMPLDEAKKFLVRKL